MSRSPLPVYGRKTEYFEIVPTVLCPTPLESSVTLSAEGVEKQDAVATSFHRLSVQTKRFDVNLPKRPAVAKLDSQRERCERCSA